MTQKGGGGDTLEGRHLSLRANLKQQKKHSSNQESQQSRCRCLHTAVLSEWPGWCTPLKISSSTNCRGLTRHPPLSSPWRSLAVPWEVPFLPQKKSENNRHKVLENRGQGQSQNVSTFTFYRPPSCSLTDNVSGGGCIREVWVAWPQCSGCSD